MSCVNELCTCDPLNSMNLIIINADGDCACNIKCYEQYKEQKAKFLNETVQSDKKFMIWMEEV